MKEMTKEQSMVSKVIEAIMTHTADTITVGEIRKEFPELPEKYVQNQMSLMVKKSFLEKGVREGQKGAKGAVPRRYRILTRQTVPSPEVAKMRRDAEKRKEAIKRIIAKPEARTDLSSAETGRSIILAYNDLQKELFDANATNEHLASEVNKERTARRVAIAEREKTIVDLKEKLVLVRNKCKELEHDDNDLRFDLKNTPRLKALNGRV